MIVSIFAMLCSLSTHPVYAKGGEKAYSTIQLEFWPADIKSDTSEGDATFTKFSFSTVTREDLFLKIAMMIGEEEYEGEDTTDVTNFDIIGGSSFDIVDLGIGFRYWENDYKGHGTSDELGPILYLGLHQKLPQTPIKVYAHFTWNFVDWGETEEHEHFTIEPGILCYVKPVTFGVGYQIKDYYDHDYRYKGPVISVGFVF